ncbi:MAG: sugar ABC transporter permease [Clostridiales bacterium]|nr:sugar ABC transporter permease [Clostridiales bacterium]
MTSSIKKRAFRRNLPLFLVSLPGLAYLLINNYIPMFGIFIAFKKMDYSKGIFGSPWCGFDNFKFLFQTKDAWVIIRNTVLYNLTFIILGTILAVIIAILMSEVTKYFASKVFQAGIILPNLVSMVIVAYLVYAFLNPETGLVNHLLEAAGKKEVNWYGERGYWPFILVFVQMWKSAGYSSIVYMASIAGIDKGLYEAARLDGAGKLRQIFSITLPLLKPTVIMMVLMSVGRLFSSDFGLFYQVPGMTSGMLFEVTQTIDTYVYRGLMQLGNVGMSSAAGLFQSVIGFILVVFANFIVRRKDAENALF